MKIGKNKSKTSLIIILILFILGLVSGILEISVFKNGAERIVYLIGVLLLIAYLNKWYGRKA